MKTLTFACLLAAALVAVPAFGAQTETWTVDPVHSTAQFTARHFGIVPVIGTIPISSASVTLNPGTQIPIAVVAELDVSKHAQRQAGRRSALGPFFQRRVHAGYALRQYQD
jgi:polyisoprenoid-binding protein YceI